MLNQCFYKKIQPTLTLQISSLFNLILGLFTFTIILSIDAKSYAQEELTSTQSIIDRAQLRRLDNGCLLFSASHNHNNSVAITAKSLMGAETAAGVRSPHVLELLERIQTKPEQTPDEMITFDWSNSRSQILILSGALSFVKSDDILLAELLKTIIIIQDRALKAMRATGIMPRHEVDRILSITFQFVTEIAKNAARGMTTNRIIYDWLLTPEGMQYLSMTEFDVKINLADVIEKVLGSKSDWTNEEIKNSYKIIRFLPLQLSHKVIMTAYMAMAKNAKTETAWTEAVNQLLSLNLTPDDLAPVISTVIHSWQPQFSDFSHLEYRVSTKCLMTSAPAWLNLAAQLAHHRAANPDGLTILASRLARVFGPQTPHPRSDQKRAFGLLKVIETRLASLDQEAAQEVRRLRVDVARKRFNLTVK